MLLWGHVPQSASKPSFTRFIVKSFRYAQIDYFYRTVVFCENDVIRFQVCVNNFLVMQVFDC